MQTPHTNCPLCSETYQEETDVRVHLEVEHRKSELASYLVDRLEQLEEETDAERKLTPTP